MTVAVNEVLTLSPAGRASREAYWLAIALSLAILAAAGSASGVSSILPPGALGTGLAILGGALAVFGLLFLIAAVVRRLHDLAYSGVAALFLLIPGVNLICLVALGVLAGSPSFNRFGPSPLVIRTITPHEAALAREAAEAEDIEEARPAAPATQKQAHSAAGTQDVKDAAEVRSAGRSAPQPPAPVESPAPLPVPAPEPAEALVRAEGEPDPAEILYQTARVQCAGEPMSVQLQVKVAIVEKLRRLLRKKKLTAEEFERWKRRVMAI